jgi:hypothetical protein
VIGEGEDPLERGLREIMLQMLLELMEGPVRLAEP